MDGSIHVAQDVRADNSRETKLLCPTSSNQTPEPDPFFYSFQLVSPEKYCYTGVFITMAGAFNS